ncbi:iron ABC transporter permease [Paracoccus suum]|uniref:Iron ABC transporter permease n=1 Tax=Paracoccus suum TaxID=2259340 RepID=A0A344PMH1_9RHOB|nr:iron ABC transporter permease [Paracoccus suum]AXC50576.1 iron ABC transporter permease [Paracoccus suum]
MAALEGMEGAGATGYRALASRRVALLGLILLALVLSIGFDMALGPANYTLSQVVAALVDADNVDVQQRVIVWSIRMPIALLAVVTGASLSVAGAQMQTILGNPLASPFTLGISAAASFGAALAIVVGVGVPGALAWAVPLNAFLMAMGASLIIHFASGMRGVAVETIVLLGIALVFTFNAALALMQFLASEQALGAVVFWTMGSLTKATWPKVAIIAAMLVLVLPLLMRKAWALTALRLGDDKAAAMGINVRGLRLQVMILVALLAAVPVAFVGTIGFVGLVGPHIARMLVGEDQRFFLPAAALAGAAMLSATSVLSKMLIPGAILPVGVVTALVGVPFFIVLIFTSRRRAW